MITTCIKAQPITPRHQLNWKLHSKVVKYDANFNEKFLHSRVEIIAMEISKQTSINLCFHRRTESLLVTAETGQKPPKSGTETLDDAA